jgi:predicted aminopeptidase
MKRNRSYLPYPAAIIAGIFCLFLLNGCYYVKQGRYLLKYQMRATANKKLMADSATPQDIKKFLERVEEARAFAFDSIGLNKSKNYSSFVKVDRDYLVDNVYAAKSDTFAQYLWHYPFFGAMPYKGFFEKAGAEKEAARLHKKGYDVFIGEIDGFSSLNTLKDPAYSCLKRYGHYSLSSLIIHELTHATIYRKNQTQFNEEAAMFVGTVGGLRYVAGKFGPESAASKLAIATVNDAQRYHALMHDLYLRLDTAYRTEKTSPARIAAKERIIDAFKKEIQKNYDSLFQTKSYASLPSTAINNAIVMINRTYTNDLDLYYKLYDLCGKDLHTTVEELKKVAQMKGDAKENLRKRVGNSPTR